MSILGRTTVEDETELAETCPCVCHHDWPLLGELWCVSYSDSRLTLPLWHVLPDNECVCAKPLRSCPTLCNAMDCSPPGSSVHGILQARILEWVAMPFSKGSFWPRNQTLISYISCTGRQGGFFPTTKLGNPGLYNLGSPVIVWVVVV